MCLETALAPFPGSCVREPLFGNIPAIAWEARLAWGAWGLNESYSVYIPCAHEWEALVNHRVLVQWPTIGSVMPMLASHLRLWVCQLSCDLCWFNTTICQTRPLHVALWLVGFFFSFIKVHLGRNSPNSILLRAQQIEQCEKIGVVLLGTCLAGRKQSWGESLCRATWG